MNLSILLDSGDSFIFKFGRINAFSFSPFWPFFMTAPDEKLRALILAESMVSIRGEKWLIGEINLPNAKEPIPADRYVTMSML